MLLIGLLLILPSYRRSRLGLIMILTSGLLIGNWQGSRTDMALQTLDSYIGQKVVMTGVIRDDPVYGKRGERQFHISNITIEGRDIKGKIRTTTFAALTPKRGDTITLEGKLRPGYGSYQARMSFAEVKQLDQSRQSILEIRDTFAGGVRNAIPEPEASLGLGFLLGQRSALPQDLDEDMRRVGLTHIVVASGYNLTILVRATRRLLAPISKYQAFVGSLGLMSAFVIVAGFSPSMTRAALVTTLSLLAWYYGRRIHPLVLILFAAAVTGLINPVYVWSDIGWYLSFLAFAGVLMLAPLLSARLFGDKQPSILVQVCIETISAQIMAVPLILWIFGDLAVYSLLANVLVVPLIPLAMLATFVAGIAGVIWPIASGWVGLPAAVIMGYMTSITSWLSAAPWAMAEMTIDLAGLLAIYLVVITFGFLLWRKTKYEFLSSSITD